MIEERDGGAREEAPLSISELLALVDDTLAEAFPDLLVAGEITKFTAAPSGPKS